MSVIYLLKNQHDEFLDKSGEWVLEADSKSLYRTEHKDEAINLKVEHSVKKPELRISLAQAQYNEKGKLVLKDGEFKTEKSANEDSANVEMDQQGTKQDEPATAETPAMLAAPLATGKLDETTKAEQPGNDAPDNDASNGDASSDDSVTTKTETVNDNPIAEDRATENTGEEVAIDALTDETEAHKDGDNSGAANITNASKAERNITEHPEADGAEQVKEHSSVHTTENDADLNNPSEESLSSPEETKSQGHQQQASDLDPDQEPGPQAHPQESNTNNTLEPQKTFNTASHTGDEDSKAHSTHVTPLELH